MLWCDIVFYVVADRFVKSDPNILDKYPKLQALHKKVASHPKIAKWIETRPETPIWLHYFEKALCHIEMLYG